MSTWVKNSEGLILTGEVISGPEVLPPQHRDGTQWRRTPRLVSGAASVLAFLLLLGWKLVKRVLFFLLGTLRPVVRIIVGLATAFSLFASVLSFVISWYQNWRTDFMWESGGFFVVAMVCSALLWYYDVVLIKLTPEGFQVVLFQ
jgi:hypothetical protein